MLGISAESIWSPLPLVIDTSAWVRARHPLVGDPWEEAMLGRQLHIAPPVRLEILRGARNGRNFDALVALLAGFPPAPLTSSIARAAENAMGALAYSSPGSHRLPPVDYLTAAAAQAIGGGVLHYDRDYDRLAEVMEFESVWLAPAGSIP